MHRVAGRSRTAALVALVHRPACSPTPWARAHSGRAPSSHQIATDKPAVPSCATRKPAQDQPRLRASQAATALPMAMPARKLASMVAKA